MINYNLELEKHKTNLSKQQYKTLRGQIKAGDGKAMLKGLNKILKRC